jgi:N-acetylmuramic acid 6-phosphate etherase
MDGEVILMDLERIETEQRNSHSMDIDRVSTLEIVEKINVEDHKVADAIALQLDQIAEVIDECSARMKKGGRLIYMGAGTSGRIGVLDASECPPTYGVSSDLVVGLIAGGYQAMFRSQEGAEDDEHLGEEDLKALELNENDTVVGLAASGRTPYVVGGLHYANEIGAYSASVSCVTHAVISQYASTPIEVITGPEAITGSTRMKAGTAEKMICNMISTGCMIRYGKVYENLMVDVQPTNEKLVQRAVGIIAKCVHCDHQQAKTLLKESHNDVKIAVIMGVGKIGYQEAKNLLSHNGGNVHEAINEANKL